MSGRRIVISIGLVLAAASAATLAEEGMWMPSQLPRLGSELEALGLKIDPRRLSELTEHPMNAVVSLGGCTASFVSPEGLVVTNHHCAERAIQYNSTEQRNLLRDGFLAADHAAELPAGPGTRVFVTEQATDVTQEMTRDLTSAVRGRQRHDELERREKKLVASCEEQPGYRCSVRAFYGGVSYYLLKQLELRDVRLVYAPAGSIGNFGGDVDNWMWPRHTGDFSFYRAYVAPDGKPADPAPDNVPYRPRSFLQVSRKGVRAGDLVLVVGYPGRTSRYRLAREVEEAFNWSYPERRRINLEQLRIIETETEHDADAAIKYASRVSGLNNSAKNYEGMLTGFSHSDVLQHKRKQEARLQTWIDADPRRRERYQSALDELLELVDRRSAQRERDLYLQGALGRSQLLSTARTLYRLSREQTLPDEQREPGYQQRDLPRIEARLSRMNRSFDPRVDRALWRAALLEYAAIPAAQHVPELDAALGLSLPSPDLDELDRRLDALYAGTNLGDEARRTAWLREEPAAFESSDDPFVRLAVRLYDASKALEDEEKELDGEFERARPAYMEALLAYLDAEKRPVYPDANGSLRVTFGTVQGYVPRDGVSYEPFTTVRGIVQKETGLDPFDSPPGLLQTIAERRFGEYREPSLDSVPVNFLSTVDTTGGNSGSPTLDARGELVGLLFDGNWESIISDWDFLPDVTRSIHVDIRYALWIMEQVDHAWDLLREMGIPVSTSRSGVPSPDAAHAGS